LNKAAAGAELASCCLSYQLLAFARSVIGNAAPHLLQELAPLPVHPCARINTPRLSVQAAECLISIALIVSVVHGAFRFISNMCKNRLRSGAIDYQQPVNCVPHLQNAALAVDATLRVAQRAHAHCAFKLGPPAARGAFARSKTFTLMAALSSFELAPLELLNVM
jgi:hypothetical protein